MNGPRSSRRVWIAVVSWLLAFAAALTLDITVAAWARSSGLENFTDMHKLLRETLKTPGEYWFTVAVMISLLIFHPLRWRAAILVLIGTTVSGVNGLTKWMVGRTRPFKLHEGLLEPFSLNPFRDGIPGLFHQTNLSFPSGHAALAFATAAAAGILLPRWRWVFYAAATIVAAERISENAHWLSDTVGAAMLGIGGVWIVRRLFWEKLARKPDHG